MPSKLTHLPIEMLTAEARKLFPNTKLLIAIDWDETKTDSDTVIRTLVGDVSKAPVRTNLGGNFTTQAGQKLLPEAGEVLQLTAPDYTVQTCFPKPNWRWFGVRMSEVE